MSESSEEKRTLRGGLQLFDRLGTLKSFSFSLDEEEEFSFCILSCMDRKRWSKDGSVESIVVSATVKES